MEKQVSTHSRALLLCGVASTYEFYKWLGEHYRPRVDMKRLIDDGPHGIYWALLYTNFQYSKFTKCAHLIPWVVFKGLADANVGLDADMVLLLLHDAPLRFLYILVHPTNPTWPSWKFTTYTIACRKASKSNVLDEGDLSWINGNTPDYMVRRILYHAAMVDHVFDFVEIIYRAQPQVMRMGDGFVNVLIDRAAYHRNYAIVAVIMATPSVRGYPNMASLYNPSLDGDWARHWVKDHHSASEAANFNRYLRGEVDGYLISPDGKNYIAAQIMDDIADECDEIDEGLMLRRE